MKNITAMLCMVVVNEAFCAQGHKTTTALRERELGHKQWKKTLPVVLQDPFQIYEAYQEESLQHPDLEPIRGQQEWAVIDFITRFCVKIMKHEAALLGDLALVGKYAFRRTWEFDEAFFKNLCLLDEYQLESLLSSSKLARQGELIVQMRPLMIQHEPVAKKDLYNNLAQDIQSLKALNPRRPFLEKIFLEQLQLIR